MITKCDHEVWSRSVITKCFPKQFSMLVCISPYSCLKNEVRYIMLTDDLIKNFVLFQYLYPLIAYSQTPWLRMKCKVAKLDQNLTLNGPGWIYQYSNMDLRLLGRNCKFLKFLLSDNPQKRLGNKENNTKGRSLVNDTKQIFKLALPAKLFSTNTTK